MDFITQWMQDVLLVVFCNVSDLVHNVSSHIIVKSTITLLIVDNNITQEHEQNSNGNPKAVLWHRKRWGTCLWRQLLLLDALRVGAWPGQDREWCCCFPGEGLHSCGKRSLPGVSGGLDGPQKLAPDITEEEQVATFIRPSELKAWPSDGLYLFRSAHRDVIYLSEAGGGSAQLLL